MWFQIVSVRTATSVGHRVLPGGILEAKNGRLTDDDPHPRGMACLDHVRELGAVPVLGRELVRDGLVVGPPGVALDMFLRRIHCGAVGCLWVTGCGGDVPKRTYPERIHIQRGR